MSVGSRLKSQVGRITLLVLVALCSGLSQAGVFDRVSPSFNGADTLQPLPVEQAYRFQVDRIAPGRIDLAWQIQPRYYLYHERFKITPGAGVKVVDRRDGPTQTKQDPAFGAVEVYHDEARIALLVGRTGQSPQGQLTVVYQGCWEGGICFPPVTRTIALNQLPPASGLDWPSSQTPEVSASQAAKSSSTQPVTASPAGSEQGQFVRLLQGHTLLAILGGFFLAGVAMAFTPCVFPMLPILSSLIAGQGHRVTTMRALALSSVYVLAMALTYTLAGILVGLFGANLQVALQQPWIIGVFAALFVALALSMFGFYELQVPSGLQNRITGLSSRQRGGTLTGVAVMGVLSALLVGPCMAAPLAGALIYLGQAGDPWLGGIALFVLALGMGVPLLLIGVSSGRLLPRAGRWMEGVRAAFGVVLLLMAVWMLDRIVPTAVTMVLVGIILIVSAVYLNVFERLGEHTGGWHRLWKGVGLVLLVYGGALLIGVLAGGNSLIYPLRGVLAAQSVEADSTPLAFRSVRSLAELKPELAQAAAAGQPVMLDFYADWCVSCKELEYVTFSSTDVRRRLDGARLIRVDLTANDAAAKALIKRYQVLGPPVLAFYDRRGQFRPEMTMIGVVKPTQFVMQTQGL